MYCNLTKHSGIQLFLLASEETEEINYVLLAFVSKYISKLNQYFNLLFSISNYACTYFFVDLDLNPEETYID